MANTNDLLKWFTDRQGKVTYSMTSRDGSKGSYDCSSAVYSALRYAGFPLDINYLGNTETLFVTLEKGGWQQLALNAQGFYDTRRGDIFIWGTRGFTLGANGHTGVFLDDNDKIIHCNYGYNGITVNDHDTIWIANGRPDVTIYRYKGTNTGGNTGGNTGNVAGAVYKTGDKVTLQGFATHYQTGQAIPVKIRNKVYTVQQVKAVNQSRSKFAYLLKEITSWVLEQDVIAQTTNKRRWGYRVDDLQFVNGLWQIRNNHLTPINFDWTDNGIVVNDVDKIDPQTGLNHSNQTLKVGDYFAFNDSQFISMGGAIKGDGGYYWAPVKFRTGGNVWLSAWNKESLFYNGGS